MSSTVAKISMKKSLPYMVFFLFCFILSSMYKASTELETIISLVICILGLVCACLFSYHMAAAAEAVGRDKIGWFLVSFLFSFIAYFTLAALLREKASSRPTSANTVGYFKHENKIKIVLLLLIVFCSLALLALSEKTPHKSTKEISSKNDYGGKTIEDFYIEEEADFKAGVLRTITYLNDKGMKRKQEVYFTKKRASEKGIAKSIIFFDDKNRMPKIEYYLTDKVSAEKGLNRIVTYFETDDKPTKIEHYRNNKLIKTFSP